MSTNRASDARPLVVVDVDGVLNAFRPSIGYREYTVYPDCEWWNPAQPLSVWLNEEHGPWLTGLADRANAQLVWGTGWEKAADTWIGPLVGLPQMKAIPIPYVRDRAATFGAWKARQIAAWAGARPFVWFDDELDARARAAEYAAGPHLVVEVDKNRGLTWDNVQQARWWLYELYEAAA